MGQLSDGQNRIGQGLAAAQYCIGSLGGTTALSRAAPILQSDSCTGLTDQSGRGCILTPPTTQFQCDTGATPSPDFSVACDGVLAHNGTTGFSACPTGDRGGYNIYTSAPSGQQGCVDITLTSDGCQSGCPATTSSSAPAATASAKSCPTALTGDWQVSRFLVSFVYLRVS